MAKRFWNYLRLLHCAAGLGVQVGKAFPIAAVRQALHRALGL